MNAERLKMAVLAADVLSVEVTRLVDTDPHIKTYGRVDELRNSLDAFCAARFDDMLDGTLDSPAIREYIKGDADPQGMQLNDPPAPTTERSLPHA